MGALCWSSREEIPHDQGKRNPSKMVGIARGSGDSWTLTGKSGSVSYGVTAPFSWVLVHTKFCLCRPRVYFPVLCKFWQLYGGVNGREESGVLGFPSRRGLTPRGSLECNPEIPAFPGEEN